MNHRPSALPELVKEIARLDGAVARVGCVIAWIKERIQGLVECQSAADSLELSAHFSEFIERLRAALQAAQESRPTSVCLNNPETPLELDETFYDPKIRYWQPSSR